MARTTPGNKSRVEFLRKSGESLAGRIALLDLTPFLFPEVEPFSKSNTFWLRGSFPDSLLAADNEESFDWRQDFIRTLLETLKPEMAAVVSPVDQPYTYRQGVRVENLHSLGQMLLAD